MTDGPASPQLLNIRTIGPEPDAATPIDAEDLEGLIPTFVSTRADLNQVEYENIARALPWALQQARTRGPLRLLDFALLRGLHRKMFEDVWTWAGELRRRETNLGVAPHQILPQATAALDDARFWHERGVFSVEERAVRIHYRLVSVHPFPNGNGRVTRLIADLYLVSVGSPVFSWGSGILDRLGETRKAYISALEVAGADEFASLLRFARS